MSVDRQTVARIAHLARLNLPEERLDPMVDELNAILDWVEQLDEVKTDDVPPMTSTVAAAMKKRVDDVTDGGYPERVTQNAPAAEDNFFTVPKVVE